MRKRPSSTAANASVAAIDKKDAAQLKKNALIDKKMLSKTGKSSVLLSISSLLILLAGLLLLRSPLFNASNIVVHSLSEEEKVAEFVDWFQAAGGTVSEKISIETFPEMGRGVVVLETMKEEDKLLFVPKNLIICYDTIAQEWSSQPKLRKKLTKLKADQEELLTAFLLLEQAKGPASRWASYLQLLPPFSSRNEVASPLLFASDADVEALQDERMIKAARTERLLAKKAHGRFKRLFRSFVDEATLELSPYVWARFLINSRAFSIQGQRVLVPFGDIFNGEPDNEARQPDNGQRFLQFHDLQSDGMTIRADRGALKGEQLFEDYGDNNNYVYFLHHGFLMGDKGFDCAAFRLPSLTDAYTQDGEDESPDETLAQKLRVLTRVRVEDAPLACISRTGKLEEPGLARIYTAVYNMDTEQAAACDDARAFSDCFPPELMSNLDDQPRQEEAALMFHAIRRQLEYYPTTIEEDRRSFDKLSVATSPFGSRTHAVAFRLSRKQILLEAQAMLEQRLQHLREGLEDVGSDRPLNHEQGQELDEDDAGSTKLERFKQWVARHRFPINHLELRYVSEAVGYGTFAAKPLTRGDAYLSVPVQAVMNAHSALQSPWVRRTTHGLEKERANVSREETLLLLHLVEETFGPNHVHSHWKPYLDMLPVLDDQASALGSPLFYEEGGEQLKSLEGTDLLLLVTNYRQRVAQAYVLLSDSLKASASDETSTWLTQRRFLWANAMLDSRSIWWGSQRHLVPLLDMVNCQELHSEHKPHHTNLDSSGRHAVTKASWEFEAGQEVVENYAQPNYIYLLYHGFVLDANSHDCAHFHFELPAPARQRELAGLLQSLQVYSWTPDVCVSPEAQQDVVRFAKIALLVSSPNEALQLLTTSAQSAPSQAISSALEAVNARLSRLQAAEAQTSSQDFRTQSIRHYRQQQLEHLAALRNTLQAP
ncbi:hypothetical protein KRP22_007582 [Phytophthora ramorum]|nr:Actin-histidine N-methyltransferase [Phytophthora ramorum]